MEIVREEKSGIVCVAVKGCLESELVPAFETMIAAIAGNRQTRLLIDLSALEYLRSPVLRVILKAVKEINQKSGKVVLCCLNGYVREIFEVNNDKDAIAITDSVETGLMALAGEVKAA
jgi:anti-anti-sigma factor